MAQGRQRDEWDRMSCLLAVIVNCNRGAKRSPVKPDKFNPFLNKKGKKGVPVTKDNFYKLKDIFCKRGRK